jgi:hypothetical protein
MGNGAMPHSQATPMSGDGKRSDAAFPSYRAHPRLYLNVQPKEARPARFLGKC